MPGCPSSSSPRMTLTLLEVMTNVAITTTQGDNRKGMRTGNDICHNVTHVGALCTETASHAKAAQSRNTLASQKPAQCCPSLFFTSLTHHDTPHKSYTFVLTTVPLRLEPCGPSICNTMGQKSPAKADQGSAQRPWRLSVGHAPQHQRGLRGTVARPPPAPQGPLGKHAGPRRWGAALWAPLLNSAESSAQTLPCIWPRQGPRLRDPRGLPP
jgi:hypothetical protein